MAFITHSSKFVFCVRISKQDVYVGDLPVLTFGNCVLKAAVFKWFVKLYAHVCF